MRPVVREYVDPLDAIWIEAARGVGLRVVRSDEVFASSDGRGTLTLGARATLDADDCAMQMILHELCHAAVQGLERWGEPDFGLFDPDGRDHTPERACLRLQAHVAGQYGLRRMLAPTTDFRPFYDALDDAPLEGDGEEHRRARAGLATLEAPPFAPHITRALEASRAILDVVDGCGALGAIEADAALPSLLGDYESTRQSTDFK